MLVSKMNEKVNDGKEELYPIKLFGMMLPSMPSLIVRLTGTFIRFKSDANKAGKIFKKELIKQGIDKEIAAELTGKYMESSHIRKYIQRLN
jgi:hypothetical protein